MILMLLWGQGFLNQWNYPNNTSALPSEYGNVFNIRILTILKHLLLVVHLQTVNDVYYNTVLGKQAITHINQDGYSMNLIYRDPYYSGMLPKMLLWRLSSHKRKHYPRYSYQKPVKHYAYSLTL